MDSRRKKVHGTVRKGLALLFWLHAFGVTRLLTRIHGWDAFPPSAIAQISILAAIAFYAYVTEYQGWSMFVDALYVYASPLILTGRLTWSSAKGIGRALAKASPPLAKMFQVPKGTAPAPATIENTGLPEKPSLLETWLAPILHFSVFWCILVAISHESWILEISLVALLLIAGRAVLGLHKSMDDSAALLEKFDERMKGAVEKMAQEVADTAPTAAEFRARVLNIKIYAGLFGYFMSSDSVKKVTRRFSLAVAVPTYVYTSLLCGFAYYDISVLAKLHWSLGDALIDALYMPIAFGDLPHSFLLRFLGGLQVASLVLIGYDAIFRSIDERMKSISQVAQGLSTIIRTDKVNQALSAFEAQEPNASIFPPQPVSSPSLDQPAA